MKVPQHTLDKAVLRRGANLRLLSKSSGAELSILQPPTRVQAAAPSSRASARAGFPALDVSRKLGGICSRAAVEAHWPLAAASCVMRSALTGVGR